MLFASNTTSVNHINAAFIHFSCVLSLHSTSPRQMQGYAVSPGTYVCSIQWQVSASSITDYLQASYPIGDWQGSRSTLDSFLQWQESCGGGYCISYELLHLNAACIDLGLLEGGHVRAHPTSCSVQPDGHIPCIPFLAYSTHSPSDCEVGCCACEWVVLQRTDYAQELRCLPYGGLPRCI
jgi:hypothetical protein